MYQQLAEGFSAKLGLDTPPVALAFVEAAPPGIALLEGEAPSACSFWRRAEGGVFYASAEQHYNCPIGAMTMGFALSGAAEQQLMGFVEKMTGCGYIALEEASQIPTVKKPKNGIVYGPLRDFPGQPDLILMWVTPPQAMLYSEAVGKCRWTEPSPTTVFGRPACAALPVALNQDQSTLSLGCAGMRTFTNINQDRMLAVVPGGKAADLLTALDATVAANETMSAFYQEHQARFVG